MARGRHTFPQLDDLHWTKRLTAAERIAKARGKELDKKLITTANKLTELEVLKVAKEWPIGTHIKILRPGDIHAWYGKIVNPVTKTPYKYGDVVQTATITRRDDWYKNYSPRLDKGVLLRPEWGWELTLEPITPFNQEMYWAYLNTLREHDVEYAFRLAIEQDQRWVTQREEARFDEQMRVSQDRFRKKAKVQPKIGETWETSDTYMRASTAAAYLEANLSCSPPRMYMLSFPEDTPAKVIWDAVLTSKKSPSGLWVQDYWISRIINYTPGLMREALRELKGAGLMHKLGGWCEQCQAYHDEEHWEDQFFRQAFHKIMPWERVEFNLRTRAGMRYEVSEYEMELGPTWKYAPIMKYQECLHKLQELSPIIQVPQMAEIPF